LWEPQKTGEKEAKDIQNQNPSLTKNKPDNSLRMIHTAFVGVCSDDRGATDDKAPTFCFPRTNPGKIKGKGPKTP
jgi:hypothetical protein